MSNHIPPQMLQPMPIGNEGTGIKSKLPVNKPRQVALANMLNERLAKGTGQSQGVQPQIQSLVDPRQKHLAEQHKQRVNKSKAEQMSESAINEAKLMEGIADYAKKISGYVKEIGDQILNDPKFQEFMKKYDPSKLMAKIDLEAKSVKRQYKDANKRQNYARIAGLIVRDVGLPAIAAILTYGSFRGMKMVTARIEKRFGKFAGALSKLFGYPAAAVLSGILWYVYFSNRNRMHKEILALTKKYNKG